MWLFRMHQYSYQCPTAACSQRDIGFFCRCMTCFMMYEIKNISITDRCLWQCEKEVYSLSLRWPTSTKPMFSLIICIAAPSLGITGPLNLLLFKTHLGPDWSLLLKQFGPLGNFWSLSLLSKLFEYAKTPHGLGGCCKIHHVAKCDSGDRTSIPWASPVVAKAKCTHVT